MRRPYLLALCVGIFITAASVPPRSASRQDRPAQLRFANHVPGTWSLVVRGAVAFSDVAPGTTTAYLPVVDSLSKLELRGTGKDSSMATTSYLFVAGSYYTVTAGTRNSDRPMLSVERDRSPGDSVPGSHQHR